MYRVVHNDEIFNFDTLKEAELKYAECELKVKKENRGFVFLTEINPSDKRGKPPLKNYFISLK